MQRIIFFCFLILATTGVHAGEVETIVARMKEASLKAETMEYRSTYELFKGHSSTEAYSSYSGYLYRSGKRVYQKIHQTEFVYGTDFFLQISHSESAVVLGVAQKNYQREIDLNQIYTHCNKKELKESDEYYLITLYYENGAETPFSIVKLKIAKKNYVLAQLDLYYRKSQDFSSDSKTVDYDRAHLRIKFNDIQLNGKAHNELLEFSRYMITKNNMLYPTGSCKGYELIDNRI